MILLTALSLVLLFAMAAADAQAELDAANRRPLATPAPCRWRDAGDRYVHAFWAAVPDEGEDIGKDDCPCSVCERRRTGGASE